MRKALLILLAAACSSNPIQEETGSIESNITIGGGESLNSISYILTNASNTYNGTENTTSSPSFIIPDVAVGSGYTLTVNGNTTDTFTNCSGVSSSFSIARRQVTSVNMSLNCVLASALDAGTLTVDASVSNCPIIYPITSNYGNPTPNNSYQYFYAEAAAPPGVYVTFTWKWDANVVTTGGLFTVNTENENQAYMVVNISGYGYHTATVIASFSGQAANCPKTTTTWNTCDYNSTTCPSCSPACL